MINSVCIEGIDGAGKTVVAHDLQNSMIAEGLNAVVFAPYRIAQEQIGSELYSLWSNDEHAAYAIRTLKKVSEACVVQANDVRADIVIYDRHWMTAFTEISDRPDLVTLWGDAFVPAALLAVDPVVAKGRMTAREKTAQFESIDELRRYDMAYKCIARANFAYMLGVYRSEGEVTVASLSRAISSDMRFRR